MSGTPLAPPVESYPLRGGRRPLTLHVSGMRHAASWLAGGESFTGFDEITDVSVGSRGMKIGTFRNVLPLPRRIFRDAGAPERLAAELIGRIGRTPGGSLQLARMASVEQLAHRRKAARATAVAVGICIGLYLLGVWLGPGFEDAGYFGTTLFQAGEHWRLVSANFLHAGLGHLILNVLGLWVLGELVEQPLGSARTILIMAASAVGAMGMGIIAGYEEVVGASGIVCGLAAAALCLELRIPERLPAIWRVPRRLFFTALAVDGFLSVVVPNVAGAAHAGGFVAGGLMALLLTPKTPDTAPIPGPVRAAAIAVACFTAFAGYVTLREVVGGPDVLARRAERLLSIPDVSPTILNNTAWLIVTAPSPTPAQVAVALRSAERAVAQTDRADPNLLDTLAESHYMAGHGDEAVETIEEAITLAPGERYFVEQRKRFLGQRAHDDRPAPPEESPRPEGPEIWQLPRDPRLPPGHPPIDESDPGISV